MVCGFDLGCHSLGFLYYVGCISIPDLATIKCHLQPCSVPGVTSLSPDSQVTWCVWFLGPHPLRV